MGEIIYFIFLGVILLISIGLHEYAHAYTSYKLGDPTPKLQNRLTPNPLAHLDPIGFLAIFIIHFGRGKPVQVNPSYYKNPLRDELIVALAGPFTNILLGILGIFVQVIFIMFNSDLINDFMNLNSQSLLFMFWAYFAFINFSLAIFNLLPIPPLDGYRLIKFFYPASVRFIEQNKMILTFIFIFILFFPPTRTLIGNIIYYGTSLLTNFFTRILASIFL